VRLVERWILPRALHAQPERRPALGIIITGCWDESWLLEIEAIAAA